MSEYRRSDAAARREMRGMEQPPNRVERWAAESGIREVGRDRSWTVRRVAQNDAFRWCVHRKERE